MHPPNWTGKQLTKGPRTAQLSQKRGSGSFVRVVIATARPEQQPQTFTFLSFLPIPSGRGGRGGLPCPVPGRSLQVLATLRSPGSSVTSQMGARRWWPSCPSPGVTTHASMGTVPILALLLPMSSSELHQLHPHLLLSTSLQGTPSTHGASPGCAGHPQDHGHKVSGWT